jgi:hypothetical protein
MVGKATKYRHNYILKQSELFFHESLVFMYH